VKKITGKSKIEILVSQKMRIPMCKGTLRLGNLSLVDAVWFESEEGLLGVVVCSHVAKQKLIAYIGRGKGENEAEDALNVMQFGSPFPLEAAISLFGEELNAKQILQDYEIIECYLKLMMKCGKQFKRNLVA